MSFFRAEQAVRHSAHGEGRVVTEVGETVVVRFGAQLQQVEAKDLIPVRSLTDSLASGALDDSLGLLGRAQALLIRSINDQWGVFSRSRVALLPHQLWVCRQVTRTWPTRWLVADDVGLGKTIEAGLILEPLMASGRIKRVLVLTPARLVPQWRERLKTMFDIRLHEYSADQDRGRISFWETASQVVASFHTLRQEGARDRLLQADTWDMVLVDEAHHFQAQERSLTLTYELLRQLEEAGRIRSLVLFTGTPHRGKDYGFLALMRLVRPDLFDPSKDVRDQLPNLRQAMIRNNKSLVTDLHGQRLFQPVTTHAIDYSYTQSEADFYSTMSAFIVDGRAYAMTQTGRQQTARMLLLMALQKLAASSIASVKRALDRRRQMLQQELRSDAQVDLDAEPDTLDEAAEAEESRPTEWALLLMKDEVDRLGELITLADAIEVESKVKRLLDLISQDLEAGEPVLLFTEYKATQALVFAALEKRYGAGTVGFINGEDRLVFGKVDGAERVLVRRRESAASDFNAGHTRFLISTEAGGEGIDLQERCATLVHVDLPWNPMRLHQRVGRINRYGQTRPVSVYLMRNPQTVEARIWQLLEEKLSRIQSALSASMEEAEDITQLVIGMAGSRFFDEVFAEGIAEHPEGLSSWFDTRTQRFGGQDAVEIVRQLVGSVARYDFQSVGEEVPRLDLPALEPFFRNAMHYNGRRVTRSESGLSVATPENWRGSLDFKPRYDNLVFDRQISRAQPLNQLLGVGHPLIDRAVAELSAESCYLGRARGLDGPAILVRVEDEVTGTDATVHEVVVAAEIRQDGSATVRKDWEMLLRVNDFEPHANEADVPTSSELVAIDELLDWIAEQVPLLSLPFRRPRVTAALAMLPATAVRSTSTGGH